MSQLVLISIGGAFLVSACLVPLVRGLFRRWGIVDKPDRERKLQTGAVSLGGGLAVLIAVCITFALVVGGDRYFGDGLLRDAWSVDSYIEFNDSHSHSSAAGDTASAGTESVAASRQSESVDAVHPGPVGAVATSEPVSRARHPWSMLFAAAAVLMLIGLLDDAIALRGRQKLLLQILVVVAVVGGGTLVQSVSGFGHEFQLGIFSYPITVMWLLAAINALNLIDGADAMAATAGAIISGGLAILCAQSGNVVGAAVAAALAGSLLGFLLYNRPPATIYLGDAGSMVIGLFVGVISIWSSVKGSTLLSFAPLMVLTLPLFDSAIAILRRLLTGRGIFAADRGHLHHRLLDRFSHRMMLVVVAGLCSISTAAAILSVHFGQQWIAVGGMLLVMGLLVCSGCFGTAELRMLVSRTSHFGESLITRDHQCESLVHQRSIQLQGDRCWDSIWFSLVEFASDRGLAQIKLDVGIAWMQEGYHGTWRRVRMPERVDQACLKMPIFVDGRFVGRLEAIGDARAVDITHTLQLLIERSEDLDSEIQQLLAGAPVAGCELQLAECAVTRYRSRDTSATASGPWQIASSEY